MSFIEDDFADFQNCTFEQKDKTENSLINDEDFADFQNADLNVNKIENKDNQTELNKSSKNDSKLDSILKDAFPNLDNEDNNQIIIINELFTDDHKRSLWNQIQNLEESPSLKLKWNKTVSFENFLSSLKINPKQTINNPHVPIFASLASLGLILEPIKLKTNNEHISISVNSKETTANTIYSSNEDKNSQLINLSSLNNNSNKNHQAFDDLDILNQNGKTDQPMNGLLKSNSTYDKLIKNIKQLPDNQNKQKEVANTDENKILDELPILDYIRSNTLMFNL